MPYYFFSGLLTLNKKFTLNGQQVAQIKIAKKLRLGGKIFFKDDAKKKYLCEITEVKARFLEFLVCEEQKIATPKFFLDLYLPILPKKELESFLFQATEIGVNKFVFFKSTNSRKVMPSLKKKELWETVVKSACENSGANATPSIFFGGELTEILLDLQQQKTSYYILHPEAKPASFIAPPKKHLAIFIGPKRGFTNKEVASDKKSLISLGENWLKPQTAALSALAVFHYLYGDFHPFLNN